MSRSVVHPRSVLSSAGPAIRNGLVGYWDFSEPSGQPRVSKFTPTKHRLTEAHGEVPRVETDLPGGSAVVFNTGGGYLHLPYEETGDLNFEGPDATFTIFSVIKLDPDDRRGGTIAGMWSEGLGAGDDSGVRQYALLLDMPAYGGPKQVTPHVSSEGGATRRADGSMLPWCADYAATTKRYPLGRWCSVACTYDAKWLIAYLDGEATPRALRPKEDRRDDRYFTAEGPDGGDRGMNPYFHGRGLYQHDPTRKPGGGSPFVVGARQVRGADGSEPLNGQMAVLAVYNRCLTPGEVAQLHLEAGLQAVE
ncbi:MAG: hypothetical protein AAGJ38_09705 [Planctomycetota bacterium]